MPRGSADKIFAKVLDKINSIEDYIFKYWHNTDIITEKNHDWVGRCRFSLSEEYENHLEKIGVGPSRNVLGVRH